MSYKKYKHLPTGKEYICNGSGGLMPTNENTNVSLPLWLRDNSKDWQEIIEPISKYLILSFKHPDNGNVYSLLKDGTYGKELTYPKVSENLYKRERLSIPYYKCLQMYHIHSIKRLSDGAIFNLNGRMLWGLMKPILNITGLFMPASGECFATTKQLGAAGMALDKATPINIDVTKEIEGKFIILPDGTKIPVGKGDKLLIEF